MREQGKTSGPDSYRDRFALIFLLLFLSRKKVRKAFAVPMDILKPPEEGKNLFVLNAATSTPLRRIGKTRRVSE